MPSAVARVPHARAAQVAEVVRGVLAPACTRIVVAGSIRRRSPDVKDIELVAEPDMRFDLAGELADDALEVLVPCLVRQGWATWRQRGDGQVLATGPRYYALVHVESGIPVDVFVCRPPSQWGAVLAIRTGPAEYSRELVTRARRRGLRCEGNRLIRADGSVLPTPGERDFVEACGLRYVEPEWRR